MQKKKKGMPFLWMHLVQAVALPMQLFPKPEEKKSALALKSEETW